ncbi:MAG: rRNA maturation RNase YbeY [Candidatus Parcubacteria bacterium]|jgi:rRNA maturation RNase YbeY
MRVLVDTDTLLATYTTKKAPAITGAFLSTVKNTILGKKYDLSISFVGIEKMRAINKMNRKIDKATDILSFPIEVGPHGVGEIFICMEKVLSKSKIFEISMKKYLEYVLLHGMVHLLGHDHGDKMDFVEKKYTKKLNIFYPYRYTD